MKIKYEVGDRVYYDSPAGVDILCTIKEIRGTHILVERDSDGQTFLTVRYTLTPTIAQLRRAIQI